MCPVSKQANKKNFDQTTVANCYRFVLDQLLPPACLICRARVSEPHTICAGCWKQLSFISKPYCQTCGEPFSYYTTRNAKCLSCLKRKLSDLTIRAVMHYDQYSSKLILPFKHADKTSHAVLMAKMMRANLDRVFAKANLVCPVPLHWLRLWHRRYNQAALIIKNLPRRQSEQWLPVLDLLLRTKYTKLQKGLTSAERIANLADSIVLNDKYSTLVKNQTCLIIDDVCTSGATLRMCAKILKQAGAKKIYGLAFAKVVKNTC